MPDLLLELFSEEIPARMQARAAEDLKRLVTGALVERGLAYDGAIAFVTPRRLVLHIQGLPVKGKDMIEERRGPRVGAPEAALKGFLKSAGFDDISQARIVKDAKKGEFYAARIEKSGEMTIAAIAEIVPSVVASFPWPKSMRFGARSIAADSLRWVRPLRSILCTFGPETEDPEVVRFDIGGIASGDLTYGHRVMGPKGPIKVRRLEDYAANLEKAKVVLDATRRRDIILHDARDLAFAAGLELVEDEALLDEVSGLVEWPVVLMGSFDEDFLAIPPEVIRATIRANQKCFVLRSAAAPLPLRERSTPQASGEGGGIDDGDAATLTRPRDARPTSPIEGEVGASALSNRFILVANLEATDGGEAIVAGNERVVRARLSDAKYFFETDRKPLPDYADKAEKPLDQRLEKIKAQNIVFHEKLGTQYERILRIAALAKELAKVTGADPVLAERAAMLAKADLVTEMVGEFPELQGLMGRYYATLQGEQPSVAAAIEEHYKPLGPSDRVPSDPVSVAVALADKLDTLVGFWAIDEKPTGSKDPFALRRAALGVIRLVLENRVKVRLNSILVISLIAILVRTADVFRIIEQSFKKDAETEHGQSFISRDAYFAVTKSWIFKFFEDRPVWEAAKYDGVNYLVDTDCWIGGFGNVLDALSYIEQDDDVYTQSYGEEFFGELRLLILPQLLQFLMDRLKVVLREQGARHDLADGVSPSAGNDTKGPPQDDLLMIVRRVEALGKFLDTENGGNLLAGYRRAANILRIEEKKDGVSYDAAPDLALIEARGLPEEKRLAEVLEGAARQAREQVAKEDFAAAMTALAELRPAVDAFFDKVTVNDPDPLLRANRLKLLSGLRRVVHEVADFSKIEG